MIFSRSTVHRITKSILVTAVIAGSTGCGDPKYRAPAIVVTFDPNFPPPTALAAGATAGVAADIANDTKNSGVNFTCAPAGACGSFTPPQIASGVPTNYQSPSAIPAGGTVNITATSVTDPTKSVSAAITID